MDNRLAVLKKAVLAGAEQVLRFDPTKVHAEVKTTAGDLVTAADQASEAAILRVITEAFPGDQVISEETKAGHELLNVAQLPTLTAWIIDPLDGTNNFKKGMAYSGISVAYVEGGKPILGAVYDPYRQELYIAIQGQGVTRNGQPINVGSQRAFDAGTRVCTSNSYEGGTRASLERYATLGHVWVDVLGSAVLIMTDVASGRLDLYHHNGLKPFDNPAAFLIAKEAGAKLVDLQGMPVTWLTSDVVMGNPDLVDEFIAKTTTS